MPERAHIFRCRVYWEDTDAAGIVYYANYLKFAERARTEMLRASGLEQRRLLEESGVAFAVKHCACEYRRPARLDDALEVETVVTRVRGASLELRQSVRRGGDALADLDVTIACLRHDGRPARLPPPVRHALATILPPSSPSDS